MQGLFFANLLRIVIMGFGRNMLSERVSENVVQGSSSRNRPYRKNKVAREGWVERLGAHLSRNRRVKPSEKLSRRNIYIFPSKAGMGFLAMLLLMLVTAINYQNSLVYLFTFTLAAVFFVSIWLCFFELSGLEVAAGEDADVPAGEPVPFNFRFQCEHDINLIYCSVAGEEEAGLHFSAGEHADLRLWSHPKTRGVYNAPRLKVLTRYPFGLVTAWTYLRISSRAFVYPRPEPAFDVQRHGHEGHSGGQTVDADLPSEMRDYQHGDALNRVVWKHFASKDQMVVRSPEKYQPETDWLRWDDYPEVSTEQRLKYLAHDVVSQVKTRATFGLELPSAKIHPASGAQHGRDCLRLLAAAKNV